MRILRKPEANKILVSCRAQWPCFSPRHTDRVSFCILTGRRQCSFLTPTRGSTGSHMHLAAKETACTRELNGSLSLARSWVLPHQCHHYILARLPAALYSTLVKSSHFSLCYSYCVYSFKTCCLVSALSEDNLRRTLILRTSIPPNSTLGRNT